jgi:hypothetical protein
MNPVLTRAFMTAMRTSMAASACMLVASTAHRGAPWAGINAMTNALGLGTRRPSARFQGQRTLLGFGILCGGLALMSGVYEAALDRPPRRRGVLSGAAFALAGYGIDRLLLPSQVLESFERGMGPVGTFAKYAALGVAAAAPSHP